MTVDGYLDDSTPQRLLLSNEADLDRVDQLRAGCDAIMVGANTVRRDNPRLLVRSAARRAQRLAAGRPPTPARVTLTRSGDLDPTASFFAVGQATTLVYAASPAVATLVALVGGAATVVEAGDPPDLGFVLADLAGRGFRRLLVEGGGHLHTQFLTHGLADELQLVIAPFFVGDSTAPRFVRDGGYPFTVDHPMTLLGVERVGDLVLLRYQLCGGTLGSI